MNNSLFSDEYFNIWILLSHIRRAMFKKWERELLRYDITPEQAETLFCTQVCGSDITPSKISRCIIREPHTIAGLLERMEKKKLIEKTKDLPRKNVIRISLTEKGRQTYELSSRRESIHKVMSCLSKRELRQLRKILEKLRDRALDELGVRERSLGPPPLSESISQYWPLER